MNPRPWLVAIIASYLLLALGYGAVNPLFEAPDEPGHFFTAVYIAQTGRLPAVAARPDPWLGQEAAQPPLSYLLGAPLVAPFETGIAREELWPNPYVRLGDASSPMNRNAFVHAPSEAWPWRGWVFAAHLLRAVSALIGGATLLTIYAAGRRLWPAAPQLALLATGLVAFLPQFTFLHGSISNDPLVIFLASFALWQLISLWDGEAPAGRLALLGITIGLAILTKMTGLILLGYALIFLVVRGSRPGRRTSPRRVARQLALVASVALMVGGWLLWRNLQLYGDPTATNQFVRLAGGDRHYTLAQVLRESGSLWRSLVGVFGWFNVAAPPWVYAIWAAIFAAGILGGMLATSGGDEVRRSTDLRLAGRIQGAWRRHFLARLRDRDSWLPLLLAVWPILVYAGLVRFMLQTPAAQGRLLFPAVLPLALGLAWGLNRLLWRATVPAALVLPLFANLACLLVVIPAAYHRPPLVEGLPPAAGSVEVALGQGLEIVGSELETETAQPGDTIWLTLYWRAAGMSSERIAPAYVLELFGRGDELAGKMQSYHGGGLYPAGLWPAGAIVADRLAVQLEDGITVPTLLRLNLKLVGERASVDVGRVKAVPPKWPAPPAETLATIDGVQLAAAELSDVTAHPGDSITVIVRWWVETPPGRPLNGFVHLGNPDRPPLAQGDGPPLGGHYPSDLWEADELFDDVYTVAIPDAIPAGRYPLTIGLYDPLNGQRLPIAVDGQRVPGDAYLVGWLEVS